MSLTQQVLSLTKDPNIIGEILRDKFFKQNRQKGCFGCYSTFELRENVIKLPDFVEVDKDFSDITTTWTRAKLDDVEMRYYWDGDGVLEFHLSDGGLVFNDDCKKDYRWEMIG